ncbi:MAG: hypothetical protein R3B06_09285 [Kofleriaceae bacterium]
MRRPSISPRADRSLSCLLLPLVVVALVAGAPTAAHAQGAGQVGQAKTILVDEGGSYEILVHPDFVTVLYLPDKIDKALASDTQSYEVKPIGATSLAIRPLKPDAKPSNLALSTATLKVSVLRLAQDRDAAMTQVTFKRADVEAELARRIDAKVQERTATLEAKPAELRRQMDAELPKVADGLIAARALQRRELRKLSAIERNDANVVVETTDVLFLGDDAYLVFEIENRNKALYRLATVAVQDGPTDVASVVRFTSDAAEAAGAGVLGVVRPGGRAAAWSWCAARQTCSASGWRWWWPSRAARAGSPSIGSCCDEVAGPRRVPARGRRRPRRSPRGVGPRPAGRRPLVAGRGLRQRGRRRWLRRPRRARQLRHRQPVPVRRPGVGAGGHRGVRPGPLRPVG